MKILFIVPCYITHAHGYYELPIGLMSLSAYLKQHGHETFWHNTSLDLTPIEIAIPTALKRIQPDMICMGSLSSFYNQLRSIMDILRREKTEAPVVIGGGIISSEPELMIDALDADYGVIGEGEETLLELVTALEKGEPIEEVAGLVYRNNGGEIVCSQRRAIIPDPGVLPFPDYEGFDLPPYLDKQLPRDNYYLFPFDYPRAVPIVSSRGCPYGCTFCFQPLTKKYRYRNLENVMAEIDMLVSKYQVNILAIIDELFANDRERLEAFCKAVKPYGLKWLVQMRVDIVDRPTLLMMKEAGCHYISFGFESFSAKILKSMRKQTTPEQIAKACELSYDIGIGIQGNFLFGDPEETLDTAQETIDWWREHKHYHINLSHVTPYPGSPLYNRCRETGKIPDPLHYVRLQCPYFNTTEMPNYVFDHLAHGVKHAGQTTIDWGIVLGCENAGTDPYKKIPLYKLTMKCRKCGYTTVYQRFHTIRKGIEIVNCRKCAAKWHVDGYIMQHLREEAHRDVEHRGSHHYKLALKGGEKV